MNIQLTNRDTVIMQEISRWRFLLSRQIKHLAGFSGQRACDRRLAKLIDANFIERRKYLYGVPSLYFVTRKASKLFNLDFYTEHIRIEQITHDIATIDTAIYFIKAKNIDRETLMTERMLKHIYGFGQSPHQPDFTYKADSKTICVEVELTEKAKATLERNVKNNFMNYHKQIWTVPKDKVKIVSNLTELSKEYPLEIIMLEEVKNFVKET